MAAIALVTAASNLCAATHYVSLASTNPTPPYTNWLTAATNIQDAVNAATTNDVVMVTNGVYARGVTVTNPLTLFSVNGPQVTVINGGGTNQCVSLTDSASLSGFTLTNGWTLGIGGGVWCSSLNALLTNCIIVGNKAQYGGGAHGGTLYSCALTGNSATNSGGADGCTLYNCTLTANSAVSGFNPFGDYFYGGYGGGAGGCTLYNCTLTRNSARYGGAAGSSTLYNCTLVRNSASAPINDVSGGVGGGVFMSGLQNCIAYSNTASRGANYDGFGLSTLNYSCTSPQPLTGLGNITNDPLFLDYGGGDLHLQTNSPCVNSGNNVYVATATDFEGNPRLVGGTVDIGAYEYQGAGSRISYAWLQQYGLPTDGSADFIDTDVDGMNNWQEWVCGTNPTNGLSVLRMVLAAPTLTNTTVTWQSVAGINYFLQRTANLASSFTLVATNITGLAGTTSYTDTNATGTGPFFYRVGVLSP